MKTKKVIFLSYAIDENTPLYSGDGKVQIEQEKSIDNGDACNTMRLTMSNHAGTHIDMPKHFLKDGMTVSDACPESWIFSKVAIAKIQAISDKDVINIHMLGNINDCDLLLIRTGFEAYRGQEKYIYDYPGVSPDIAIWLKDNCPSIRAIGIDTISISSLKDRDMGRKAHSAFLENNILLIEDMKLSEIEEAPYEVIVAPLIVRGADACPVTVLGIYR
jgi:arylformamidase